MENNFRRITTIKGQFSYNFLWPAISTTGLRTDVAIKLTWYKAHAIILDINKQLVGKLVS